MGTWIEPGVVAAALSLILGLYLLAGRRLGARYGLLITSNLAMLAYMTWRLTGTLDLSLPSAAISIALAGAELLGAAQHAIFSFLMANPQRTTPPAWPDDRPLPSVDVFVPTYNEPVAILRRTLAACGAIRYPTDRLTVYVLDDGRRVEVKKLADELGVRYVSRPNNEHAKAGNLNHALQHSTGSLILILDADMVPKSWILERMVGFFSQPRMGFVQAPQAFFNPDPFQHNLTLHHAIPNEQDYFMRDMLAARDRFNAVMFVGSNALFSRAALESLGGFCRGSITEDVPTGALLQSRGYTSAFLNEIVATGLAAESFREMLQQRVRWARGYVQAWRGHRLIRLPGFSWQQRLLYLSGLLYWYFGVQKLIYTLAPLLFLSFGLYALHAAVPQLLLFWLPAFASSASSFRLIARRRRTSLWSHIYEMAVMCPLAWAMVAETLHLKLLAFRVTKKGLTTRNFDVVHQAFWPLAALALFSAISIAHGLDEIMTRHNLAVISFVAVNVVWAAYNLVAIVMGLLIAIDRPRPRQTERFRVQEPVTIHDGYASYDARTVDLSESGVCVTFSADIELETDLVEISFAAAPEIRMAAVRVWNGRQRERATFHFIDVTVEQYRALVQIIFDRQEELDAARIRSFPAVGRGVVRSLLAVRHLGAAEPAAAVVRRAFDEVFSNGDMQAIDALFAPSCQLLVQDWPDQLSLGRDGVREFVSIVRTAFPDLQVTVQRTSQHGGDVIARWVMYATHSREWLDTRPDGRRVTARGLGVFRVDDGRIVEWRSGFALARLENRETKAEPGLLAGD